MCTEVLEESIPFLIVFIYLTVSIALFSKNSLITFPQLHIHTFKLPSATDYNWLLSNSTGAIGVALLKGTLVVLMRKR